MTAARRSRARTGSTWLTLVGLALLAVPGFALGLVTGVAWEEPGLLVSHLFGGTQEVAWSQASPLREARPELAAERPASTRPAVAALERPAAAATERPASATAELPAVAAPPRPSATRIRSEVVSPSPGPAAGRFAVQVGAFAESESAERLAETLRGKGFDAYVSPGAHAGEARWRVRVGPLPSREEAERVASRLKAQERLPTWVLDEDRPA